MGSYFFHLPFVGAFIHLLSHFKFTNQPSDTAGLFADGNRVVAAASLSIELDHRLSVFAHKHHWRHHYFLAVSILVRYRIAQETNK